MIPYIFLLSTVRAEFGDWDDTNICSRAPNIGEIKNAEVSLEDCTLFCQITDEMEETTGSYCCHYAKSPSGLATCILHGSGNQRAVSNKGSYQDPITTWYASFTFETGVYDAWAPVEIPAPPADGKPVGEPPE